MIQKLTDLYKKEGFLRSFYVVILHFITYLTALPTSILIIILSPLIQIRLIKLFSSRIGHYALNTELMLCTIDAMQNETKKFHRFIFYTSPGSPICNLQLHQMWKRKIMILPCSFFWSRVDLLLSHLGGKKFRDDPIKIFESPRGYQDKERFLEKQTACHIELTDKEKQKGEQLLNMLGIPKGTPYVCLLMRDSHYLKNHFPHGDWSYHDYRDVNTDDYKPLASFLAKKGYFVIRMGKHVGSLFDLDDKKVIDYANSPLKSDFMDVYLCAQCDFMISTSSGLDAVAQLFKKPILITDFPLCDLSTWFYWSLFIPKKIMNLNENKFLTFKEMYEQKEWDKTKLLEKFHKNKWIFVNNTPDELIAAAAELLDRLQSTHIEKEEDTKLQEQFWHNYPLELPKDIFSYQDLKMRIANAFLRSNTILLS